jgi:IS6 family transposase
MRRRPAPLPVPRSSFAGFRFPPDEITVAVRWHLCYGLSYRDVEELLAERGIEVDHVTIYRWVQRFTPLLIEAARPRRHVPGDRWFVDETTSRSLGGRSSCTGHSISSDRSSTCSSRRSAISRSPAGSSPRHSQTANARPRSPPTGCPPTHACSTSCCPPPATSPAVCKQPGRSRSRTPEGTATTDARPETTPLGPGSQRWAPLVQTLHRGHYELGADAKHRLPAAFGKLTLAI